MKNLKWSKSILFLFVTLSVSSIFILGCKDLIEPKTVPSVVTGDVSNATATSATVGGQIVTDGNTTISDRGVVIGKNTDPTINDTKVTSGNGVGTFSVDLSGLSAATTYHVRAFGTNIVGTSYGLDKSFTTSAITPTLTTTDATSITYTSATIGGNISSDGGSAVLTRGICYGTSPNPTTANQKTTEGSGTGAFSSNLTSLSVSTKYYARAYATNAMGTSYGNEISFTTLTPVLPTVTTTTITEITVGSSKSGGNITNDGGSQVTARGVCWGLNPSPTIADDKTTDGSGNGSYTSIITSLTYNKKYYVRAYATNSAGTAYGEELAFTTPSSPIPLNGLVGWWPFNANAKDESGNGNDGLVNGAALASDRFGKGSSAFSFTGSNSIETATYITGNADKFPTQDRTVSLWFYTTSIGNTTRGPTLIGYGGGTCGTSWIQMINSPSALTSNTYEVQGHCSIQQVIYPYGTQKPNGQWVHWVITTNNSGTKFYINGELKSTSLIFINKTFVSGRKFFFGVPVSIDGNTVYLTDSNVKSYEGILDDIAIYNRALTADEILKIYDGTGF